MSDRELLELAAKAAGRGIADYLPGEPDRCWNPLTDDSDALRLAVKLNIDVSFIPESDTVYASQRHGEEDKYVIAEACDAFGTRRAIVRAAAAIGRSMP